MITLKKPIQLKSLLGITYNEAFSEKIRANYKFITAMMSKEELLHLLLSEPEQIEAGNAVTMIVENVTAVNRNEIMIELLNQVFNRILMVGESGSTYQDNVYIGCVLRKLGIADSGTFLKRIQRSKEEYFLKHQLLKKYEKEKGFLKSYYQLENGEIEKKKCEDREFADRKDANRKAINKKGTNRKDVNSKDSKSIEERVENYLYEEVMRRLHTMQIYQSVNQWNYMQGMGQKVLFHNELALSEQQENVLNMRLAQEKREFVYPRCQMDFISSNLYEAELPKNTFTASENVFAHLLTASVFHLAKSVSLAAVFRQGSDRKKNYWYEMGFEICSLIKNTINRCQWQYQNYRPLNVNNLQNFFEWQNRLYRYELNVLQEMSENEKNKKEALIYAVEEKERRAEDNTEESSLEKSRSKENSLEEDSLKENGLKETVLENKEIALKLKEILNGNNMGAVRSAEKWKEKAESFFVLNEKKKETIEALEEKHEVEREQKEKIEKAQKEKERKKKETVIVQKEKEETKEEQKEKEDIEKVQKQELEAEDEKTAADFYYEIQRIRMAENYFCKYLGIFGKKTDEIGEEYLAVFEKMPVQISKWIEETFFKDRENYKQFYQNKWENIVEYFSVYQPEEESEKDRRQNKEIGRDLSQNNNIFYQRMDTQRKENGQENKNLEKNTEVKRKEQIKKGIQTEKIELQKEEKEIQRGKIELEKKEKERQIREERNEKLQRKEIEKEELQTERFEKEKIQIREERLQTEKIQAPKEKLQTEKIEMQREKMQTEKIELQEERLQTEKIKKEAIEADKVQEEKIIEKEAKKIFYELDSQSPKALKEAETIGREADILFMTDKEFEQIKNQENLFMTDKEFEQIKSQEISNPQISYKESEKQKNILQDSENYSSYNKTKESANLETAAKEIQQERLTQQKNSSNISKPDILIFHQESEWTEQPVSEKQNLYKTSEKQTAIIEKRAGADQMISGSYKISQNDATNACVDYLNKNEKQEKSTKEIQQIQQKEISQIFYELNSQKQFLDKESKQNNYKKTSANLKDLNNAVLFMESQAETEEAQFLSDPQKGYQFNEISADINEQKIIEQINFDLPKSNQIQKINQGKEIEKILTKEFQQKEIQEKAQKEIVQSRKDVQLKEVVQLKEAVQSREAIQSREVIQSKEIQQIFHEIETEIFHDTQKSLQNLQRNGAYSHKTKSTELIYRQTEQNIPESADFNKNTNKTRTITEEMAFQNKIKFSNPPAAVQNHTKSDTKQINEVIQVIQTNIQKQINQITEQVYQKIEKKLQNERRRRGL